jgi:hypothetical protein
VWGSVGADKHATSRPSSEAGALADEDHGRHGVGVVLDHSALLVQRLEWLEAIQREQRVDVHHKRREEHGER